MPVPRDLHPIILHRAMPEFLEGFFDRGAVVALRVVVANRDAAVPYEEAVPDGGQFRFQLPSFRDEIAEGGRCDIVGQIFAERAQASRLNVERTQIPREALDGFAVHFDRAQNRRSMAYL